MPANAADTSQEDELDELRARLEELEETLRAIHSGEVDALVVDASGEDRVFTLTSADQTYRLMVEQMQKGVATVSEDGVVLYSNRFLGELLGLPCETLLGASLASFADAQSVASLGRLLRGASSGVSRGEVTFRKGAGTIPTRVSITQLPLEGVRVFCVIVTDLTESLQREAERAQLASEQAARAAAEEANRLLHEEIERRIRVEESLRQADRLKDEFLATLSHELRTPLSAIVSWSHVLRQPGLEQATASRAVEGIERNAWAQTRLVEDILDVSRIVTGQFHMSQGPVRLYDVIEAALETVRPAARARDIHLELAIDPMAGPVLGDASRLQQVVWNLVSNAVRFAPTSGHVEVRVAAAGASVELSVTDDGPGIDPAFLPYVFDRFRQADSSSTRGHAGLGLGLAIVRHLVELHGGTVEARNRAGQAGAVFLVRLPHQPPPDAARPAAAWLPSEARVETPLPAPSLEHLRVLMVDDDADTREAMSTAMVRYGAQVATATCATQALSMIERELPHVVVADIGMPGEDGYALLRRLRALPKERGGLTPVIALTAYASEQNRQDALRAGFQAHVSKPATPAQLAAVVAGLVPAAPSTPAPD